jgi:hypothetical protein
MEAVMRKLKLDLDSIVVQSFETVDVDGARGTVDAHESTATTGGPYLCAENCASDNVGQCTYEAC